MTRCGFKMKSLLAALVAAFVFVVPASASAQSLKSALDRDLGRALNTVGDARPRLGRQQGLHDQGNA